MDQNYIIDTLKNNINRQSALDTLIDFERVLDNQNIYTYANWLDGEVVEGPHIEKYWVTVTLMYPYKKMPDPEAAKRLLKHDCKVYYAKDTLITAAKLKDPTDSEPRDGSDGKRPGQHRAKKIEEPIWLVTLEIPRKFMQELATADLSIANDTLDGESVSAAMDDGAGDNDATAQI
jgi:hypothetical protein